MATQALKKSKIAGVTDANHDDDHHDHHHKADSTDIFGFWLYIMTDCVLFGSLFATYAVLYHMNMGNFMPHIASYADVLKPHLDLHYALLETFFLLGSNFTFGMAIINMYKDRLWKIKFWLLITFILGAGFVSMEVNEFINLYHEGISWRTNGAVSSFFVLVGTHGLHVSIGLIWILMMIVQLFIFKITPVMKRRLTYLGLFWNFLEIVWIFVLTIVYFMGVM